MPTSTVKAALGAAILIPLGVIGLPIVLIMMSLPGQGAQQFFATCTAALGTRGAIVANPPDPAPTATEVLLKIDQTARTLGFGTQGATVTAAIAIHATGLANAANPANEETMKYAHTALLDTGAGALGLPLAWASPAELMTPEVSTALALDTMLEREPRWRDNTPEQLAATITGATPEEFTESVAAAQQKLAALSDATPASAVPMLTSATATTTTIASATAPTTAPAQSAATTLLNPAEASAAIATAPEAANCLHALTTALPAPASTSSPDGPAIAAAAQHAVGTDQTTTAPTTATAPAEGSPTSTTTPDTVETTRNSAQFVTSILTGVLGADIPTTIGEQLQLGYRVMNNPEPGDLVYTDISATTGPHLAGIAVDTDTMVTILPGHPNPEWAHIGPNRLIRRIEKAAAA
ncbi:hypothetical protein [Mycobacteroides abscessus]|uniref:hypothetical protein n=1 Tax=Mycobacteroides abscessus TaxID=36809 RepID=UPI00092849AF|nr:hypothetical protein [Mycobacteroides abscessus]SII81947.1 Uncharacterised protein [Mycobacteroides abscessus subsp. abscessus]SIK59020.1 Uncharacterised protein [Mycobacteroides abscessus subsp. abscessus]SIL82765.1 Uncharacterised protein [Mycobacteroides abscessus subsp. abscessus]SIM14419.1 Uncharacterised protein [Mycobacteroides abscessus subsp. abscessus]SIM34879.1 Uncharacterised protein [Mycobacteroides abscessus subsp. abscessus]